MSELVHFRRYSEQWFSFKLFVTFSSMKYDYEKIYFFGCYKALYVRLSELMLYVMIQGKKRDFNAYFLNLLKSQIHGNLVMVFYVWNFNWNKI